VPQSESAGEIRNRALLGIYVNDHLAASTGGKELVSRMISAHTAGRFEEPLRGLLDELHEEQAAIRSMMATLDIPVRQYKQVATWVGEKLARLKLNGHVFSRSPMSSVIEFEFISTAVLGKRAGFETLRELADVEPRLDAALLDRLIQQADQQHEWLTEARRELAAEVWGGRAESASEAAGR
jgi:hypothetical protein